MSISMPQLRSETLEHLGIDPEDLDDTGSANLDLLINRSWWEICDEFKFKEKEQSATFSTVDGTRNYSIATIVSPSLFEAVQTISIKDPSDSQHTPLDPISQHYYETNYNEQTTLRAKPTNYFHNGGYLYLYPTPDAVYEITIWHNFILTDLSGANNPTIPQNWHEAILYGAVYRGHLRARDYNSATQILQLQKTKIITISTTDAKEDANIKLAGVRVIRPTYNVRHG